MVESCYMKRNAILFYAIKYKTQRKSVENYNKYYHVYANNKIECTINRQDDRYN